MSNLNEQQFAQYSALRVHDARGDDWEDHPLPASMERHAPGQYQPTLPGMEKMIPGELTHSSVFFKRPNAMDMEEGEVPGSTMHEKMYSARQAGQPDPKPAKVDVQLQHLSPTQDWMHDSYLHTKDRDQPNMKGERQRDSVAHAIPRPSHGRNPIVEKIPGSGNVIHDGHHRVVREILAGTGSVRVNRWDA